MDVTWLVRDVLQASQIMQTGSNPKYLSFASLNINYINAVTDMEWALKQSDIILFAVPSAYLKQVVDTIEPEWLLDKQLAVSIKGFVKGAGLIPGRFLQNAFPGNASVIVIGGQCHAEEIALERNNYITIAVRQLRSCKKIKVTNSAGLCRSNVFNNLGFCSFRSFRPPPSFLIRSTGITFSLPDNFALFSNSR